jgi:hypothetical protein
MRVTVTPDQIRAAFEAVKDDPSFDESRGLWERGHQPVTSPIRRSSSSAS